MNRERIAWLISVALLAIMAVQLPGSLAQRDDDYAWVRTLVQLHRQVVDNYVEPVDDAQLREDSIKGMLSDLDRFTNYIPPAHQEEFENVLEGQFKGVGITLRENNGKIEIVTPIEDSPADHAGIHAGDVLQKVDGKSILGMAMDDIVKRVTGPVDTKVILTVARGSEMKDFTMTRQEIVLQTVKGFDRNPDDSWNYWADRDSKIGYIRVRQFDSNTFDEMHAALAGVQPGPGQAAQTGLLDQGMKGLILDLRFNPGGQLEQAVKIVNMFVKAGSVIVTTRGHNRPEEVKRATGEGMLPDFPVIVLVNDESASAAEIVSGSLKDNHRAFIIGQRTYGKGSVQEVINLDDGDGDLKLTVAYYYLPSGRLVHRKKDATDWGVEPQIHVDMNQDQEKALDEQFEDTDTIRRSAPSTQPTMVDPQLKRAINVMLSALKDGGQFPAAEPTTQPTTQADVRM